MKHFPHLTDVNCRPSVNPNHEAERQELARMVDDYLANGGTITKLDAADYNKNPYHKKTQAQRALE